MPVAHSWLYTLFVGIDANFRMKRKAVSSEEHDPSLTRGYGYFVEEGGYQAHLGSHAGEKQEVGACRILHAAAH